MGNTFGQDASSVLSIGGTSSDRLKSMTTDQNGNIYLLGQSNGIMEMNGTSLPTSLNSSNRTFVTKLDVNKNLIWHKEFDYYTPVEIKGSRIVLDNIGNIYVTDRFFVDFDVSPFLFSSANYANVTFKLNVLGNIQWAKEEGGRSIQMSNSGDLEIFQFASANDSVGNELITNYLGTVVWLDFSGNYIDHIQIDNPNFGTEIIAGRNADNLFYGYRRQFAPNVVGTLSTFELLIVDSLSNIVDSNLTHYSANQELPLAMTQDSVTKDYYMMIEFSDRQPLHSTVWTPVQRFGILRVDENLNVVGRLYLSGSNGANNLDVMTISIIDDGVFISGKMNIPFSTITWTSLGQNNYLYPEDDKMIIAKLSKDLSVKWFREIPEKYYANSIYGPYEHNGNLIYHGTHKDFVMDGIPFVPFGSSDIYLLDVVDNDSTNIRIQGSVFHDNDQDGFNTALDDTVSYKEVSTSANSFDSYFTNVSGSYDISGINGSQIIKSEDIPMYWMRSTPDSIVVNNTLNDTVISNIDFGIYPIPGITDLEVNISALTAARLGFDSEYLVEVCNVGTEVSNGTFYLKQSPHLSFISSEIAPTSISGDTLFYSYSGLAPLDCITFKVLDSVANNMAIFGFNLLQEVNVIPVLQDSVPQNNYDFLLHLVTGSYDPNDITVSPNCGITENFIQNGSSLDYLIRFQNTGTDTAFTVTIRDTLSAQFDYNTFEFSSASHNVEFSIVDSILVIQFDNILLTDSTTNFEGSKGYFTYSIQLLPTVIEGETVLNTASIFFDFNAPIITNTAITNIVAGASLIQTTITDASCFNNGNLDFNAFCVDGGLWVSVDGGGFEFNENGTIDSLNSGSYSVEFTNGADSVNVSSIVGYTPLTSSNTMSICDGDSLFLIDEYISAPGVYTDTLQSLNGCDSILITTFQLDVLPIVSIADFAQDTLCTNSTEVALPQGTPIGGSYSGFGASGNSFDPSLVVTGEVVISYSYTNSAGCSAIDSTSIYVDECLAIKELLKAGIKIGPNPFNEFTVIDFGMELNGEIDFQLTNLLGQNVMEVNSLQGSSYTVYSENLDAGIYKLILIESNSGQVILTLKLVVQ
jgi:uncharacterized repeat protein (TIGR01451 family)